MNKHLKRSKQHLIIAGQLLDYDLVRSKKRRRSIALKLKEDNTIQVNCPYHMPLDVIESFIISKYSWIQKNIQARSDRPTTPLPEYQNGEPHLFKGQTHILQRIKSQHNEVLLKDDQLIVFHRHNTNIKKLLKTWYRNHALEYFTSRTITLATKHELPKIKDIKVRYMKARWGSCSHDAVITYNVHLIKADEDLIDYVIMHELCHLIHHNHSPQFYQLQTHINPHWKTHKQQLDQLSIMY